MEKENKKKEYPLDWSDKVEPYTTKIAMGADALGLTAAATGVGAGVGGTIATIGNVPNLLVDLYQTGRDLYRSRNDRNYGFKPALINAGETVLDLIGVKALKYMQLPHKITTSKTFMNRKPGKYVKYESPTLPYKPTSVNQQLHSLLINTAQDMYHSPKAYEKFLQYTSPSVKQIIDLETAPPIYFGITPDIR